MLRGRTEVRVKPDESCHEVRVCTDLRLLQEFIKLSHKSCTEVEFDVNEAFVVRLTIGDASCQISGYDGSEFPLMRVLDGSESSILTFQTEPFQTGLSRVIYAVGNDDLRPALMGVNMKVKGDSAALAATNGHILSVYEAPCDGGDVDYIIPRKALQTLADPKMTTSEYIRIYESGNNLCAKLSDFMLYFRVVDAKYPNYEAVIPRDSSTVVKVDRALLLSALKRVGLFSNEMTKQVVLNFKNNANGSFVDVKTADVDRGKSASECIDVEYTSGEDIEIGFNAKLLIETLGAIESDVLRIEMSAPNRAALIYGATDIHLCLVMPVMIS